MPLAGVNLNSFRASYISILETSNNFDGVCLHVELLWKENNAQGHCFLTFLIVLIFLVLVTCYVYFSGLIILTSEPIHTAPVKDGP